MANYTSGQDRRRRDVGNDLANRRVLLVEDETLLALDLEMTLAHSGCKVIGAFATARAALAELARSWPDAAVLDLNLNGETSLAVADALAERGVPFVFVTGYDRDQLPPRHKKAPMVAKPYSGTELVQALQRLLEQPR